MTNPNANRQSESLPNNVPSTQTFYRLAGLRKDFDKTLQSVYRLTDAKAEGEEGEAFKRIIEATNPTDIVRMAPLSRGVAQLAWTQRMNEFGMDALPHIVRRMKSSQSIPDEAVRHIVIERLIGALRRLDEPGGQALLQCFNNLDTYGQSLACVALGLMQIQEATQTMARFYSRVKDSPDSGPIVGALWGLIDVQHPQVDEWMAELMRAGLFFAEQYAFASLRGGEQTLRELVRRLAVCTQSGASATNERYSGERDDILMALTAIGYRLGAETYRARLDACVEPAESVQSILDVSERASPERIARYFKMYYEEPG